MTRGTRQALPRLAAHRALGLALGLGLLLAGSRGARAEDPCGPAIAAAEARYRLPAGLLRAIAEVETGRPDPRTGRVQPWPWATNAENQDRYFVSSAAAAAWVRSAQARGVTSIDVGCLQVNLRQHPDAFASIEAAFEPAGNADYAARFLLSLRAVSADWAEAVGWYHSHTEALAVPYRAQVRRSYFADPRVRAAPAAALAFADAVMSRRAAILADLARAWSATLPPAPPPAGSGPAAAGWTEAAAPSWRAAPRLAPGAFAQTTGAPRMPR